MNNNSISLDVGMKKSGIVQILLWQKHTLKLFNF